ncbi:AbrB/MazE/SpoVT family DNA-binding domain-containing protein [Candidatus Woesearchaeota archaeon]|nr:AbrB/MazE/SpoVT family DNA-binding domain-containing protein [Candidatus Woesearchaeota archaeon]
MGIAKVTTNYQVTIPKDIRRIKSIAIGDTVLFAIEGDKVDFLKISTEDIIDNALGGWKGAVKGSSAAYVRAMRKGWSRRAARLGL